MQFRCNLGSLLHVSQIVFATELYMALYQDANTCSRFLMAGSKQGANTCR